MTRLLEILVAPKPSEHEGQRTRNDMISTFDAAGCGQAEIAAF